MSTAESGKAFQVTIQYVLSPILVIAIGFYFNHQLESTKQSFRQLELELKQIEAAQNMLEELFSDTPERAFVAEILLSKIVEKELAEEIKRIVEEHFKRQVSLYSKGDQSRLARLTDAARTFGSEAAKAILEENYWVIVGSFVEESNAVEWAKGLSGKGYSPEVYSTTKGYHSVSLGPFPLEEAEGRLTAYKEKEKTDQAFLANGDTFVKKVYPSSK